MGTSLQGDYLVSPGTQFPLARNYPTLVDKDILRLVAIHHLALTHHENYTPRAP